VGTLDAHCHLDQLGDPDQALADAVAAGVERVLSVSEDSASARAALELKRRHPGVVLAGVGLHPMLIFRYSEEQLAEEERFVADHLDEADVLGEIGLDYFHARTDEQKELQGDLLGRLLELAAAARKPINLHSRRAQRQTMERAIEFTRRTGLPALLHWFTASKKLIRSCSPAGVYVSVGPSVLFDGPAQEVCLEIPEGQLLVETDSPVPFGGEPATPAWAARVTERLARLRGIARPALERQLEENFQAYLGQ